MTLYKFIRYVKFLWGSTNQHGVHSPFVYRYLTQCLYTPRNTTLSASEDVLVKSIAYFNYKHIALVQDDPELRKRLLELCDDLVFAQLPLDVLFARARESTFTKIDAHQIHNGTLLVVADIYENKEAAQHWNALRGMEQAQVTIDVFHCGLIFFRREQARQHFKLRL